MKKINTLLLITILLYFTGCEDKKSNNISTSNIKVQDEEINSSKNIKPIVKPTEPKFAKNFKFIFKDINENNHTITLKNKKVTIEDNKKEVILINFFSTQCSASIGQIPYLIDIQKKYNSKLVTIGILLNSKPDKHNLKALLEKEEFNYTIYHSTKSNNFTEDFARHIGLGESFLIPMSILLKNGKYYAHYEGAVPIEMLEYDIKNKINKDK